MSLLSRNTALERFWIVGPVAFISLVPLAVYLAIKSGNPASQDNPGTILAVTVSALALAILEYKATMESIRADYFGQAAAQQGQADRDIESRHRTLYVSITIKTLAIVGTLLATLWALSHKPTAAIDHASWAKWETDIAARVAECNGSQQAADAECVKKVLHVNPPEVSGSLSGQLVRDLLAGQYYLTIPRVSESLQTFLGVRPGFLGTGIVAPQGKPTYAEASLHEYFAPNLNVTDGENNVIGWILPSTFDGRKTLKEIITSHPKDLAAPTLKERERLNVTTAAWAHFSSLAQNGWRTTDGLPVLVRFERFPAEKYSWQLGRKDARRVFCASLQDALNLTLDDALVKSGHEMVNSETTREIFIWVFVPRTQSEAIPATWGTVRSQIDTLLAE